MDNYRKFGMDSWISLFLQPLKGSFNFTTAHEFAELQKVQNDELTKCCENFFETLDGYAETKNKHRSATWPLQVIILIGFILLKNS